MENSLRLISNNFFKIQGVNTAKGIVSHFKERYNIDLSYDFINSNTWNLNEILEYLDTNEEPKMIKSIDFTAVNPYINFEIKYFILTKIIKKEWSLNNLLIKSNANCLSDFFNSYKIDNKTIMEVDYNELILRWNNYFLEKNYPMFSVNRTSGKHSAKWNVINQFYKYIRSTTFNVNKWDNEIWDVRNFPEYDFKYVSSSGHYIIKFSDIENPQLRKLAMEYTKIRLLSHSNFTWGTAIAHNMVIKQFYKAISKIHPEWNNLNALSKKDVDFFMEELSKTNSVNIKNYIRWRFQILNSFLEYIQHYELHGAPTTPVLKIIRPNEYSCKRTNYLKVDEYIPETVLEQIMNFSHHLPYDTRLALLIMFGTGLRISDTLNLKYDCVKKQNNGYWLVADISKTSVKQHKIPITDELAGLIHEFQKYITKKIHDAKYKNEEHLLFYSMKLHNGRPISQRKVLGDMKTFAKEHNISDEMGNIFNLKNHIFRHTYAMSCLNNGMDIITLQGLMAHHSPEMTLCYAKLLDKTKKEIFDSIVEKGVFSFKSSIELKEENPHLDREQLDELWLNYKLNAIDTPYGLCMQRVEGKCTFAKQPPCLTCNNGAPCKNLCIGANDYDTSKYETLINSAKEMISIGERYKRTELVEENSELLKTYSIVLDKISKGNIIYGRINRLKDRGEA